MDWVEKASDKNLIYLRCTMDDNLSLADEIKEGYRKMYHGMFFKRYILGQWCTADGLIYQQFAENTDAFMLDDDKIPERFAKILIGVDWGDAGSGHSFTAVGITPDLKSITVLSTEKHSAKDLTPKDVEDKVVAFVTKVIERYGPVQNIFCDHVNTFINGCRVALRNAGLLVNITQAYKCEINERILTTCKLMALGRLKLTQDCQTLVDAFCTAVWDSKHQDKRLDDGTSDIDSLDSFEYAWSTYIDIFTNSMYMEGC